MNRYLTHAMILIAVTSTSCATALSEMRVNANSSVTVLARGNHIPHGAREDEPLAINLSHHVASEPAQVTAHVRVEPDTRSRFLTIEWWAFDDLVGGSHPISLEGDRSAIHHYYPIKRIEAGEYVVTALLTRADGTQVKRQTKMIVAGEGTTFDVNSPLIAN